MAGGKEGRSVDGTENRESKRDWRMERLGGGEFGMRDGEMD